MIGIFIAFSIFFSWLIALTLALTQVQLTGLYSILHYAWLVFFIQFLFVGIFITVHDACHGSVSPRYPSINLWIGRTFAFIYAGLIFDTLQKKHAKHHLHSGTHLDPDFHQEGRSSLIFWLLRFSKQYVSVRQILTMCVFAQILMHGFHLAEINVFAFWVAPSLLSSLQLFYFGTYLPHRKLKNLTFTDRHHTRNFKIPFFASWISCYHFGAFHHRHHLKPRLAWFQLSKNE
ncbi:MAG: fatty acid desaturase [Bdellovibrio sp.]|nr:fatty acid desaturase [Bdellovibrio sp.]